MSTTNIKKTELRKTGGGPPSATFSQAEQLDIANNKERPIMEGVKGAVTSDPGASSVSTIDVVLYQLFDCSVEKKSMQFTLMSYVQFRGIIFLPLL